jgi:hypothetical protein
VKKNYILEYNDNNLEVYEISKLPKFYSLENFSLDNESYDEYSKYIKTKAFTFSKKN